MLFIDSVSSADKWYVCHSFGGFAYFQATLAAMESHNEGGNVLVTGATSSRRGREGFASFAASKSGLRAMCEVRYPFLELVYSCSLQMCSSHRPLRANTVPRTFTSRTSLSMGWSSPKKLGTALASKRGRDSKMDT